MSPNPPCSNSAPSPRLRAHRRITGKNRPPRRFPRQKALLVLFICAHCPYVKHIEKSLGELAPITPASRSPIVAISSNDVNTHPADSPAGPQAAGRGLGFDFPYLYDESQAVAHAYKAACTPDIPISSTPISSSSIAANTMTAARETASRSPAKISARPSIRCSPASPSPPDQRPSIGCNIKWKDPRSQKRDLGHPC
jgi:hypothetical protein